VIAFEKLELKGEGLIAAALWTAGGWSSSSRLGRMLVRGKDGG